MRLTEYEQTTIKDIVASFDPDAEIRLFGSRVDDDKKGGDIDLLIISKSLTFEDKLKIRLKLYERLGEQKIDIIITKSISNAFQKMAFNQSVVL